MDRCGPEPWADARGTAVTTSGVNHLEGSCRYARPLVRSRSHSPAPRRTTRTIVRATLITAVGFAGVAALLTATRDTAPTSATGSTVPTTATTSADGPNPASPATTARKGPATTKKPGSPTTKPSTPATTMVPTKPSSPEGFARGLYADWKSGNRKAAASVATAGAIDTLFARKPAAIDSSAGPKDPYTFTGCTGAAGSEVCRFDGADGTAVVMKVRTETGGLPMMVTEVKFPPPGE